MRATSEGSGEAAMISRRERRHGKGTGEAGDHRTIVDRTGGAKSHAGGLPPRSASFVALRSCRRRLLFLANPADLFASVLASLLGRDEEQRVRRGPALQLPLTPPGILRRPPPWADCYTQL